MDLLWDRVWWGLGRADGGSSSLPWSISTQDWPRDSLAPTHCPPPPPPPWAAGDGTGYRPIAGLGKQSNGLMQPPGRTRAAGNSPWNAIERTPGQERESWVLSPVLPLAVLVFLGRSLPIFWVPARGKIPCSELPHLTSPPAHSKDDSTSLLLGDLSSSLA